jgi:hypothetical protein
LLKVRPVARGDVSWEVVARGLVEPTKVSDVVAPVPHEETNRAIPLRIKWLVPAGASVKKGDKLAVIDEGPLRAKLKEQLGVIEQAQARLLKAAKEKEQTRQFHESAVKLAKLDFEEADAALKQFTGKDGEKKRALERKAAQTREKLKLARLQGDKENARAELAWQASQAVLAREQARARDLEATIGRCTLLAPQDGGVVYWLPEPVRVGPAPPLPAVGAPVSAGQKLLFVFDLNRFRVKADVWEMWIARVRLGQRATVRVDAFHGRLLHGQAQAIAETGVWGPGKVKVYPVTVALDVDTPGLRPGMSGEVTFLGESRQNVLRLPVESVFGGAQLGRIRFCLVKTASGFEERQVALGFEGNQFVEVAAGVREGEPVLDLRELADGLSKWLNPDGQGAPAEGKKGRGGPPKFR